MIEKARCAVAPAMSRIVVGVDPSGSDGSSGDAQGIVVCGLGSDGRGYVLADGTMRGTPQQWSAKAAFLFNMYQADLVVAERNFGGAMVESVLRAAQPDLSIKLVTASRGKSICAEPIAALYQRGRVGHIGDLAGLEAEMVQMTLSGFTGGGSPNALDAMVWALSELVMTNKVCANFLELIQQELREYGIPQAPVVRQIEYARGSQEWLDALQNGAEND